MKSKWLCLFLLLVQCASTEMTVYTYSTDKVTLDEFWEAYVRVYEKYFAIAQTTTSPHTLTSKPKIQLKVLDQGTLRVRRKAYGELKKMGSEWIYSMKITMEVDRPEQFKLEEKELKRQADATWSPEFQELTIRPEDNFQPSWKMIGRDEEFEEKILEEILERIRPKLDT